MDSFTSFIMVPHSVANEVKGYPNYLKNGKAKTDELVLIPMEPITVI